MKFLKGLNRDVRPLNQPVGSWRDARNILVSKGFQSVSNEDGFNLDIEIVNGIPQTSIPFTIIGIISFTIIPEWLSANKRLVEKIYRRINDNNKRHS